jgi:hypothetical protein
MLGLLVVVSISGCGQPAGPLPVTANDEPLPVTARLRLWWEQITDTNGAIEGRITFPDGRPVARAAFACRSQRAGLRVDVRGITTEDGAYWCRGSPGIYTLIVQNPAGPGTVVELDVEIPARHAANFDIAAHDPRREPTP